MRLPDSATRLISWRHWRGRRFPPLSTNLSLGSKFLQIVHADSVAQRTLIRGMEENSDADMPRLVRFAASEQACLRGRSRTAVHTSAR